jgi:hypothetical protein
MFITISISTAPSLHATSVSNAFTLIEEFPAGKHYANDQTSSSSSMASFTAYGLMHTDAGGAHTPPQIRLESRMKNGMIDHFCNLSYFFIHSLSVFKKCLR